jgi:hypothetical protein
VLFRLQGERVNVDTRGDWDVGVVLVRLNKVEVGALAFRETVMTVEE